MKRLNKMKESYGLDDIFEPEFDIGDRVWFHDDDGESNWFIVTNVYDDDRYDLESEDGEEVVQDVDGSKLSSSPVDGEMFHESTDDSGYFKEKFLDVTMNELGFSEDEIEGLIEQWN